MKYYFLPEDFAELNNQIRSIADRIKNIGKEMGASCEEGAETFHDNFAFEDGERQQRMWSNRLRDLIRIQSSADICKPSKNYVSVHIGCKVTISDIENGEEKTIRIGSYMNFNGNESVSYNAPLARILMGKKAGELCKGKIAGKIKHYEIIALT